MRIGRLEVAYHDGRVVRTLAERRATDAVMLAMFLAVLAVVCWLSIHLLVTRPLSRLKESLNRNARTLPREPLDWRSMDELGEVVNAYNVLLRETERQASALAVTNTRLWQEMEQRNQAEEQLRLAATVFEVTIEGIAIMDPRGIIRSVNQGFERITGYPKSDVVGRSFRHVLLRKAAAALAREASAGVGAQGFWKGEAWNARRNGEEYFAAMTVSCVRGEAGGIVHYIVVFNDVTERKTAETALLRSRSELEKQVVQRTWELRQANEELRELDRHARPICPRPPTSCARR